MATKKATPKAADEEAPKAKDEEKPATAVATPGETSPIPGSGQFAKPEDEE